MSLQLRAMLFALIIYAMLIGINLTAEGRKVAERLHGPEWLGMPSHVAMALITGVLTAPLLAVPYHLLKIMDRRWREKKTVRGELGLMLYLLRVGRNHPDLRLSQAIVVWGGVYLFALAGGWIAYTTLRHV